MNAISIKNRLKNQARVDGKTMQDKLITYGLERAIYRLSVSKYVNHFALKGGVFLYALFEGKYSRMTMDIDLLGQNISNEILFLRKVFEEIFSIECDDAIVFDLKTLEIKNITEFKEYRGVNVLIMGYLDNTKIPVSIDIGFGDIIYPEKIRMEFPILLDMEAPLIYTYSIYSAIAEKFEAIVSLGLANSRFKDFYDIYFLINNYDIDGEKMQKAIIETFNQRKTGYDNIAMFEDGFETDTTRQNRWNTFVKKKKVLINEQFQKVLKILKDFLFPIIKANKEKRYFLLTWNANDQKWS